VAPPQPHAGSARPCRCKARNFWVSALPRRLCRCR
jgi:hypothetical protein